MPMAPLTPWFSSALSGLPDQKGLRILMLTCDHPDHARTVARRAGGDGYVVLVEPDPDRADAATRAVRTVAGAVRMAPVEAHKEAPQPGRYFGTFDAVLAAPWRLPDWPLELWGKIAHKNLRPGGRLSLDVPAPTSSDALIDAWNRTAPDGVRPGPQLATGLTPEELAASLRDAGLRSVEGRGTHHVVGFPSLVELAEAGLLALGLGAESLPDLQRGLMEHFRAGVEEPVETAMRRTAVQGMR